MTPKEAVIAGLVTELTSQKLITRTRIRSSCDHLYIDVASELHKAVGTT